MNKYLFYNYAYLALWVIIPCYLYILYKVCKWLGLDKE